MGDNKNCKRKRQEPANKEMSKIKNRADEQKVEECLKAIATYACDVDMSPLSPHFRQLCHTLNPNLPFSFESLERNCLKVYAEWREKAKKILSELGGHVSLSVDFPMHWKSYSEYVCLIAHFIDDDWKLQKWVIKYSGGSERFEEHEDKIILKALKEWDIEGKVLSITDGATSDLVEMVKEGTQERMKKLPMNGELFHVRCCSGVISRMVEDGFKEIRDIINNVKLLSWSNSLPLWYLTSSKLRNALQLEEMGEFSSELVRKDYDVPSEEEWGKVRNMCRIVDRIYEILEGLFEVERPRWPTSNLFLPHLQEIRGFLTKEVESCDEFMKGVAQKMLTSFNEYWKDMYLVLAVASFMDPRYKMKFIEFCSSNLEGSDEESKASSVLETIRKIYDGYAIENNQKEYLLSDSSSEEDEDEDEDVEFFVKPAEKKCINLVDRMDILRDYRLSTESTVDQIQKSDLDLYLEEPIYPWTEKFSVLKWWKDNCSKYPHLSRMARDFLAIPLSVATSYEAYYTVPREADTNLLSLKPELMNALKCTRSWKLDNSKDDQAGDDAASVNA